MTMDSAKALEHARTIQRRLMDQGRTEEDARRDAENWVRGNFGIEVSLLPRCEDCGNPAMPRKEWCADCMDRRYNPQPQGRATFSDADIHTVRVNVDAATRSVRVSHAKESPREA